MHGHSSGPYESNKLSGISRKALPECEMILVSRDEASRHYFKFQMMIKTFMASS
jgi:polysaccharide pyruvyl transferase WcaK-like protein